MKREKIKITLKTKALNKKKLENYTIKEITNLLEG